MSGKFHIENEAAMLAFGAQLVAVIQPGNVVFLYGEPGAGKTTLVRGFLQALGFGCTVKSPTYTLVEQYLLGKHKIFHFDLYRLADPDELEYMGIRDYFEGSAICFVEWPERGVGVLPAPDLEISILYQNSNRILQLSAVDRVLVNQ